MVEMKAKKPDCDERSEALAARLWDMIDKADLCPYHSMTMLASILGRTIYNVLPDEYVDQAIDQTAVMAKSLVKDNANKGRVQPNKGADLSDLVEMIMATGATKH
jgi:hypothetical protein